MRARSPHLICLARLPWSDQWKRHQSMVHHLAQQPGVGRVVFVNPSVRLSDLMSRRLTRSRRSFGERWIRVVPKAVSGPVIVWSPLRLLPLSRTVGLITRIESWLMYQVIRLLNRFEPYDLLILGVNLRDQDLQRRLRARARRLLFDWSDDFTEFSQRPEKRGQFQKVTDELIKSADLILAVNEHLAVRAQAAGNPRVRVVTLPNSTSLSPKNGEECLAERLRVRLGLRRPMIGYAGTITGLRMDLDLIRDVAKARPEWTLVFVGPNMLRVGEFPVRENIVLLPAVPHHELMDYLQMFDVCILPHTVNAHTNGNDPIKLYDYLMAGKPVVSTPVAGVERFKGLVEVADSSDEFVRGIEKCLAPSQAALREMRIAAARENSWPERISHLVHALELDAAPYTGKQS